MKQKFEKTDAKYLEDRCKLSEKYGPRELWSVIDHWPLYCGIGNLARFVSIYEIFRSTLDVPGHVAEFGSWRGANLLFLAKLMRILDPHGSKQVHCFDSFEGLTSFSPEDGTAAEKKGAYKGSFEEMADVIGLYGLEDEIDFHKGLVEETLQPFLDEFFEYRFSFVYCDVDLYEATKQILIGLHPRMCKGGVFVLDEWNYSDYPGESAAVREFLEKHGSDYAVEQVRNARQPSLVLRKTVD